MRRMIPRGAVHYRWFFRFCDGVFQGFDAKVSLDAVRARLCPPLVRGVASEGAIGPSPLATVERQLRTLRLNQSTPLGVCYAKACRTKDRHQIQEPAPHRCLTGDLQRKSAKRGDVSDINAPTARQQMFTCARGGPDLIDQSSAPGADKGKSYAGGVSSSCLASDK
jgi:hypothetical protein